MGDVLAGLVDAATFAVRPTVGVPEARSGGAGGEAGYGGAARELGYGGGGRDARYGGGGREARSGSVVPEAWGAGVVPGPARSATAATAACARCGARAAWHRTVHGRWILIEPGELTAGAVPAGSRWRVAGDGTAVNLGSAVPSDTCRVSHFDVCAAGPAPVGAPVLLALWRGHARRIA
ncbi:DUF6083 domain-containing protein [Streptomyces sp. Qhu_M48]|uniref:DUF6083 domain-containing protein n=1 Tax=Streptomyces sp. Qhu_M48 TaxID=3435889 RepID=UPI003F4FCA43